tara:strand:- start:44 stop:229 length:186 start_codon:yes stop_codon:yes gene_type:complete
MVELEPEDFSNILKWFEYHFAKVESIHDIPMSQKRTFWKLTFLAEDKIKEIKNETSADERE